MSGKRPSELRLAARCSWPGGLDSTVTKATHNSPRRGEAGLTFLEVMCAAAILAGVAAAVLSALSYVFAANERDLKRLAAAEVANRLMLIRLDSEEEFKRLAPLVSYGNDKYRYSMNQTSVGILPAKPDPASTRGSSLDRFLNVSLSVWLSEESGGSVEPTPGVPSAMLVRVVDPIPLRNPNSLVNTFKSDEERANAIRYFTGGGGPRPNTAPRTPPRTPSDKGGSGK